MRNSKLKSFFVPRIRIFWFALMVLCLGYSMMVYLVASGTLSFTIWLAGAAFFGACFFFSGKERWGRVAPWIKATVYAVVGFIVAVFAICHVAMLAHFFDRGEADLDYIVVLGAQMRDSGPSIIYKYRLEKAIQYLEENPDTICITTGARGANESISEGEGGRNYLVSRGIPEDRILVEEQSRNTGANIENALAMMGDAPGSSGAQDDTAPGKTVTKTADTSKLRIGIVTNGFHVFRGIHLARKLTDAHICGIAAYMQPQFIPNNMVRECFGIVRDFLRGDLG